MRRRQALVVAAVVQLAACAHPPPRPATPVVVAAAGADPGAVAAIHTTYSFEPHELTDAEQTAKSKDLDALWSAAEREPARYLPALRAELGGDRQLPFFYYDGGQLLLKLSAAPADRALALAALARVDLRDVAPLAYVQTVHLFARDGLDTSAAAFAILAEPKFDAYVPEHDLHLDHGRSLEFMLLPSAHDAIAAAIVARYPKERTDGAKKGLLTVAYDFAPAGDALVRRVASDAQESPAVREYARTLVKAMSDIAATDPATLPSLEGMPRTVPEILAARRKSAGRISDEALDELSTYTLLLRTYLAFDARKSH